VRVPIALTYSSGKGLAVLGRLWPVVEVALVLVLLEWFSVSVGFVLLGVVASLEFIVPAFESLMLGAVDSEVLVCAPAEPAATRRRTPQMASVTFIGRPFRLIGIGFDGPMRSRRGRFSLDLEQSWCHQSAVGVTHDAR